MCLAIPAQVLEIKGYEAVLDFGGVKRKANVSLLEDVKIGDYVIVHVGFAIQKLDKKEAEESLKYWKEILEAENYAEF
ncbi:MAG: HypC/HybG/HupF family hydrogenase formation chaperone [Euryarchaeota archaeon]|nr:HypC/HybG/HupF family hydrogenase formation chaperone [Euryarchaeota archaeon]